MAPSPRQPPPSPDSPSRRKSFTDGFDELAAKQRLQIAWNVLGYSVVSRRELDAPRTSDGEKIILHDCCGHASPGKLLAVMGSSGAGKTTLLNCLAGRRGTLSGEIRVNGSYLRRRRARLPSRDGLCDAGRPDDVDSDRRRCCARQRRPHATSAAARDKLVASVIQTLHLERAAG